MADERVVLRSFHNTFLHAQPDGIVAHRKEPYEWLMRAGSIGLTFESVERRGWYLSARPPSEASPVLLLDHAQAWEVWKAVDGMLRSHHGTHLSAHGECESVYLHVNRGDWERITVVPNQVSERRVVLCTFHTTHIFARADGTVGHREEPYEWVQREGPYGLTFESAERRGSYLSADPPASGSHVLLRGHAQTWETWTQFRGMLRSHHGTHLAAHGDCASAYVHSNRGEWEQITIAEFTDALPAQQLRKCEQQAAPATAAPKSALKEPCDWVVV